MLNSKQVPLEFQTKPKKFKKYHKIKLKNSSTSLPANKDGFVFCGLDKAYLTVKQMLVILKILKPQMKKIGRSCLVSIKPVLDNLLTKKPKDIRMGRGKGLATERVAIYKAGSPIFKLLGLTETQASKIFRLCIPKFATKSAYIKLQQ